MASAYIIEAADFTPFNQGYAPKIVKTQRVIFSTSTASAAFDGRTKYVGIEADALVHFKHNKSGVSDDATDSHPRIQANVDPRWYEVEGGDTFEFYDGTS